MSNKTPAQVRRGLKDLVALPDVENRFQEILGDNAPGFISSILQVTSSNKLLSVAEPSSILAGAATSASLKLWLNNSLGYAWLVPYKESYKLPDGTWAKEKRVVAQFQIGWKGYVQLAQRTGQYSRINVVAVYENQFKSWNPMFETLDADFSVEGKGKVVGYAAGFALTNGFTKLDFWTTEKVQKHAKTFSQSYSGRSSSPWKDQFDAMAKKTVLKNTLAKWGPMSIEMQNATKYDQAVRDDFDAAPRYADNQKPVIDLAATDGSKERLRVQEWIEKANQVGELEMVKEDARQYDLQEEYDARYLALTQNVNPAENGTNNPA